MKGLWRLSSMIRSPFAFLCALRVFALKSLLASLQLPINANRPRQNDVCRGRYCFLLHRRPSDGHRLAGAVRKFESFTAVLAGTRRLWAAGAELVVRGASSWLAAPAAAFVAPSPVPFHFSIDQYG